MSSQEYTLSKSCSSCHNSMAQMRPHYICPHQIALAPCKADDWFLYPSAYLQSPEWTHTCTPTWTAYVMFPDMQSAIKVKPSTDISAMSIGELRQKVFCYSCTNTVEQPTTKHQTIPVCGHIKSHIKTHFFQLAYFTWLFKCMCECWN